MRREFLKDLGIEDKDIIDKILNENSADIGRAKGSVDELKSQITQLQTQLTDKTNEYNTLAEKTKDFDSLTQKVTQLEGEKNQLKTDMDNQLNNLHLDFAVENGLRDAGAKNVKAAKALLDMSKITRVDGVVNGLNEQIEVIKTGEDSAFLFSAKQNQAPYGTHFNNPPSNGGNPPTSKTFADAVANALKNKTN
jgi:chromosome segregation ATPase